MEESSTKEKTARKWYHPTLKKLSVILIILGVCVIMYVPSTWLLGWWERRGLASDFDMLSVPTLTSSFENDAERLKQLAIEFKKGLRPEQPIAQLEIPRIGINAIVVEGTEEGSLRKGPGHLEEGPLPGMKGNFSLAGDRVLYGGPFLNLDELEVGDEIIVKMPYGLFKYAVANKFITDPEDVTIVEAGNQEVITLITCDPPWDTSHRLVIKGTVTSAELL
jgi:sortase A